MDKTERERKAYARDLAKLRAKFSKKRTKIHAQESHGMLKAQYKANEARKKVDVEEQREEDKIHKRFYK